MKIDFLQARNGDCIHIRHSTKSDEPFNILIDGGVKETYGQSKNRKGKSGYGPLKGLVDQITIAGEKIDLLILTHIDGDHIDGLLKWFEQDSDAQEKIVHIWFNSGRLIKEEFVDEIGEASYKENDIIFHDFKNRDTGISEGVNFEELIQKKGTWFRSLIRAGQIHQIEDLTFQILSPSNEALSKLLGKWAREAPESLTSTKESDYASSIEDHIANDTFVEDDTPQNGSSIAFVLSWDSKKMLFLADAHPSEIIAGLKYFGYTEANPIEAAFVKVSHHGSKANTSIELLQLVNSNKYIISTDGSYHKHPHKQMLSRLLKMRPSAEILFNYPEIPTAIFSEADIKLFPDMKLSVLTEGINI